MPSPDVVFALTGDVRRNSRALKQLRALAALGATVEVLTFGPPADDPSLEEGIRLRVLHRPPGSGPRLFARVHRLFAQAARQIPARVYHASDLYTLPALHAAAQRHGGRLVYDARELYPFVASTARRPWVRGFWRFVEGRHIRHADAVFTVSESIADRLAQTYGVPRPLVLHNVPPYRAVTSSGYLRAQTGAAPDTVVLLHQGQIQRGRGGALLADAMREVQGAVLVFLGGGSLKPTLQQQVATVGLGDRVRFLDPVPPDALLPVTASADVGITLLEDTCLNHRFALPNKLFEYLMARLPVLASDLPEIRGVVETFDVGCVVDPADRAALVKMLQHMVDDNEARARWAAHAPRVFETFSWEKASQRFTQTYQDFLNGTAAP
ncbi:MAG: glycosyltransferase family 4 protein [Rhodothermales bacterium]